MNTKKISATDIDEKALLDSIYAKKNPAPDAPVQSRRETEPQEQENVAETEYSKEKGEKASTRKKRKEAEDYRSVFLKKKELKTRQCVYISMAVHEKIQKIVRSCANLEMTVGGYIDTVLWEHLETNRDEINELYRTFKEQDDKIV
jgi:hypothetical protein